jgi:hypothetical protein
MNLLTHHIISAAIQDIGIKETSRNDGPEIAEWRKRVGVRKPCFWCAIYSWCKLDDACKAHNVRNLIRPTASVHTLFDRAKDARVWTSVPGPGMIFGQDHGGGTGHCGIIISINGDFAETVEGNSNAIGARDADRVAHREGKRARPIDTFTLGCLDPSLMLLAAQAERA